MQNVVESRLHPLHSRAAIVRRIRLWAGLVLFSYLVTHIANLALGLISLEAMESGRVWFLMVWRSPLGTIVLYASWSVHVALALWSLYQRHHFRIPFWEAFQIILGLAIPLLLVNHMVGTRLASAWFGTTDSNTTMVLIFWKLRPDLGVKQSILLTVAWTHGCVALHYWLRLKPWYPRLVPVLLGFGLLLPILALLGFNQAGREVSVLARETGWAQQILQANRALSPSDQAALGRASNAIYGGYAIVLALMLIARVVRHFYEHFQKSIRITYPAGKEVSVPRGFTVLEASRRAGIRHAAACGGRGRCTTCRVRVLHGLESLPPMSIEELDVLHHIEGPPNVRLACQLRPTNDISVMPLLSASTNVLENMAHQMSGAGQEKEIVVLFADLRRFTRIAEHKLPYDVVFLLNRYFEVVGEAIEKEGGVANQFTGDGVMALFGLGVKSEEGCRQALAAACAMVSGLAALSRDLTDELQAPLRMGIGIHTGPAVVGHMGRGIATYLTAVGDTVHVASRFQEATKEYGCQVVISDRVAERAGIDVSMFPGYQMMVRNRRDPMLIRAIKDVQELDRILMGTLT
jgi:adenylate cyclase